MRDSNRENQAFWAQCPCGQDFSGKPLYTREFFAEVEEERYRRQPFVFSFAQFTRFHGKKILEVGTGLGIDFLQWVRAGARAYGVDLTEEAVTATRKLLEMNGLQAEEVRTADAEDIPYPDHFFDLVYSWGVLNHTANIRRALEEVLRVTRPGGTCKIMLYNRYSMQGLYLWLRHALLKGRPFRTLSWCFANHLQSKGTLAHRPQEIRAILKGLPASHLKIKTVITDADLLKRYRNPVLTFLASAAAYCLGWDRAGLYMLVEFQKSGA